MKNKEKKMNYHYTECGLDNVIIVDMPVQIDDAGEGLIHIPNIYDLHRVIALSLITQDCALRPTELRFLRTELGFTQAQLADVLHMDAQSIGRWERGECAIDPSAEIVIRKLAIEMLDLVSGMTIAEIARKCIPSVQNSPMKIDGSDPSGYRPIAA